MKRPKVRIMLLGCAAAFIALQFIQPAHTNPPSVSSHTFQAPLNIPSETYAQFHRACFDCHANTTVWPWYSNIAPVNLLVVYDVTNGREHLNFSEWNNQNPRKLASLCENISLQVKNKKMPFILYRPLHPDASLSESDRTMMRTWADSAEQQYRSISE